jgi:hypothetical protein
MSAFVAATGPGVKRLTFVADTGAGVSSTFVAITEALVHAENAIVEGGVAIAISSSAWRHSKSLSQQGKGIFLIKRHSSR